MPSTMPARADPKSDEARLLGPFSKRRQVNIHWRYFTQEWKKVLPPLQVAVRDRITGETRTDYDAVIDAGIRPVGFERTALYDETILLAGDRNQRPPKPKRERGAATGQEANPAERSLPRRFIRRRYQYILQRLPILTYSNSTQDTPGQKGTYSVSAIMEGSMEPHHPSRAVTADPSLLEWLPRNESADATKQ